MRRASDGGVWWASPVVAGVLALAPAVLALFLQIHELTLPNALTGATFSADGANLGSALLLSSGRLPYDNFVLAQPPGMTILMLPFAWAAHVSSSDGALAAARIVTAAFAVANVLMVGLLARHRGFASSIVAGVALAIYPFAFAATGSALIGPYLVFFCLLGLLLAFPGGELSEHGGRLVAAGVLLGLAVTIKPWAIVPAAALLTCAVIRWRVAFLRVALGFAGGVVVPCIIFLLAAPGAFWHDIVVAELQGVPGTQAASTGSRLADLLGLSAPLDIHAGAGLAVGVTIAFAAVVVVLMVARLRLSVMADWVIHGSTVVLFVLAFLPHSVPTAYRYFVAAFLAVVLGTMVGNLLSVVSALPLGGGVSVSTAAGGSIIFVALTVGLIAFAAPRETRYERTWFLHNGVDPRAQLDRLVPKDACAISNDPSVLIVADRMLGQPDTCAAVADPAGVVRAAGPAGAASTRSSITASWEQWMNLSHFVVINTRSATAIPWTRPLQRYFAHNFSAASHGVVDVYVSKAAALP